MSFPTNCEGRIINVESSSGCTLTRASIRAMTPQDFEDQGFQEVGMDRLYATAKEARAAGFKERTLSELLMSRVTPIKDSISKTKISPSESVILPYIVRRQKRPINSNYWKVTAGAPNAGAGSNGVHPGAQDLTVTNNPSRYASTLTDLHNYFIPGRYLVVEYANASTLVAYSIQYKILAASTVAGVCKVVVEPNVSSTGWAGYTSTQKLPYQYGGANGGSLVGFAYTLANSVSDYESHRGQHIAENPNSLIYHWLQTTRTVHEYTDEYLKALNAALTSNYFKKFRTLPLAEQKAIAAAKNEKEWLNSVWWGQRINEFQGVETYTSLPGVYDPNNPSCLLEYKSNALGFDTQLGDCNRKLDHQGLPLNMDTLFSTGYDLLRARSDATGSSGVDTIDWMTDRYTAGHIHDLMLSFYKAKGINFERHMSMNEKVTFEGQKVLQYNKYELPPDLGGYTLAIFHDQFFDDRLVAGGSANRQRTMWAIDWSDVQVGIAAMNSVKRETNVQDALFNYVMKVNVNHVMMDSMLWTAILEDPNRHYVVNNFSNDCPSITVAGCTV